jgi:hypothetical protein
MARRIEEARARLAKAAGENGSLLEALGDRRKGASPVIMKSIETLETRANEISGGSVWWQRPKSINTFRAVGDALDGLATAVDNADAAPSPDAVAGFDRIRPTLDAVLAAWEAVKAKELAALNGQLKKAGKEEIVLKP